MVEIERDSLREFTSQIPNFLQQSLEEQFIALGYFVQEIVGDPVINGPDFVSCFKELDMPIPDKVDEFLLSLGSKSVFITKENRRYRVSATTVDEFQKKYGITPPPKEIKSKSPKNINEELSKFFILHRKITDISKNLFLNGHYPQAIFEAVKMLEQEIQNKSEIHDKIGVDLVNHVFSEKNPLLKVIEGDNIENIDEREGFRYLLIGVFRGIKNPQSHSIQELNDPTKAIEYLAMMSILLKKVQDSKK